MPTAYPALFATLATPFEPAEVKVRSIAGRQLHYVTARTIMNRLDEVLGPEHWWDEYAPHENSVLCRLTIRLPDGSTLTKADAGGYAGMADSGDDDKSGYSDAFKRAAVKFGVGRYLYRDGVPSFVTVTGQAEADVSVRQLHATTPPVARPAAAPASKTRAKAKPSAPAKENLDAEPPEDLPGDDGIDTIADIDREQGNRDRAGWAPCNGSEFYAWLRKREAEYPGLTKRLNRWAAAAKLPVRIVGWDPTVATRAYQATRKAIEAMDRERQGAGSEANGAPADA